METKTETNPEFEQLKKSLEETRNQLAQYEAELVRVRRLADDLALALAKATNKWLNS